MYSFLNCMNNMDYIFDVDTGSDDALALILAAKSGIKPKAILTSYGNVSVDLATENTLGVLDLFGDQEVKVFRGTKGPLVVNPISGSYVSCEYGGLGGLYGVKLPIKRRGLAGGLDDFETEALTLGDIAYVAMSPCTNLAIILRRCSAIKKKVKAVLIMGGALERSGNATKYAEFNFFQDAFSVQEVLQSGLPCFLVTLDVTSRTVIDRLDLEALTGKSRLGTFAKDLILRYLNFSEQNGKAGFELCDPVTVGALLKFVEFEEEKVNVVTEGENYGQLIRGKDGYQVFVSKRVRAEEFVRYCLEKLDLVRKI